MIQFSLWGTIFLACRGRRVCLGSPSTSPANDLSPKDYGNKREATLLPNVMLFGWWLMLTFKNRSVVMTGCFELFKIVASFRELICVGCVFISFAYAMQMLILFSFPKEVSKTGLGPHLSFIACVFTLLNIPELILSFSNTTIHFSFQRGSKITHSNITYDWTEIGLEGTSNNSCRSPTSDDGLCPELAAASEKRYVHDTPCFTFPYLSMWPFLSNDTPLMNLFVTQKYL